MQIFVDADACPVVAMALGKGAYAIHQSGKWYTNDNIDQMLMERHLNKKARRSSRKCHIKGPKKRTEEDGGITFILQICGYCTGKVFFRRWK